MTIDKTTPKDKSQENEKTVFKRKITNQPQINGRNPMKYTSPDCSHFEEFL